MSIIDTARDALKGLPISDIVRERLSLALDRLGESELKNSELQTQIGRMQSDLARERQDHEQAEEQLKRLKEEHEEEVRIHSAIEFRLGKRTGGVWMPFCPKCHMPLHDPDLEFWGATCSGDCGWMSRLTLQCIESIGHKLQ